MVGPRAHGEWFAGGLGSAFAVALAANLMAFAGAAAAGDSASLQTITAEQWGSVPAPVAASGSSFRSRPHSQITGLTVHHQGEIWRDGADVAAYLRRLQQWSRRERVWVDVPYHFVIAPDGVVYEGRSLEWAGDSNTAYLTAGQVQVMLLGNFQEQEPSAAQLLSATRLLAKLMVTYSLGPQTIVAHRHHTTQTVCPGQNLMAVFDDLRREAHRLARAEVAR
jgi:hypothetical protein